MKHHLFSRFTSVLLAVVLLAGLMGTPILATDNVLGAEPAATVEEQTAGSADESASGVDSAAAEQAEETTTDEEESASSDSNTDTEISGEEVVTDEETDSTVPAGDESDSTVISEEESTDSAEGTEPADETEPTEEEVVELTASVEDENGNTVANVTVEAAEDVIPEGAKLVAELLTGAAEEEAVAELNEAGVEYDGYMALDIHLENIYGEEVEPSGEVRVVMVAPAALPEDADPTTVTVQHHEELDNGEVKVEQVASAADASQPAPVALFAANDVSGQPAAVTADNGAVTAEFAVESFSTFTITWGTQEDGEKVTVYYVATNGSQIKNTQANVTVNTGDTVELDSFADNIDGYWYQYALVNNGPAENGDDGVQISAIKYSEEDGWQYRQNNTWTAWQLPTGLKEHRVFLVYSVGNPTYDGDPGKEVDTVSSEDIKINLFDYNADEINDGHTLQFKSSSAMPGGDASRGVNPNYWTNYSDSKKEGGALQGIVENTLPDDGFPVLQSNDAWNFKYDYNEWVIYPPFYVTKTANIVWNLTENKSLSYLFNTSPVDGKIAVEGVDHLFQQDADGYYYYDSAENIAVLPKEGNGYAKDFKVYSKSSGLFNPFQSAENNGTLNSHFGMTIETSFVMPENGQVNGQDMVFEFTGDDDVWVFIDDVLVLDIGGIHGAVSGTINFNSGKVWIDAVNQDTLGDSGPSPDDLTIESLFEQAGDTWNDETYSTHTLKFFYLERGSGSSNCRIRFNLPIIPKASLVVSKDLAQTGSESLQSYLEDTMTYRFRVVNTETNGTYFEKDFQYKILEDGKEVGTGTVDKDGIFTLKAGQAAVFPEVFEEDADPYYVQELLPLNAGGQYDGIDYIYAGTVSETEVTDENGVTVGDTTYAGYKTEEITPVPGRTANVSYTNTVNTDAMASLRITKQVQDGDTANAEDVFQMQVKVNGELLAKDTTYTVGGAEKQVATEGIIELKAGETATILMLADSTYEVQEVNLDTALYKFVSYQKNSEEPVTSVDLAVIGTIEQARQEDTVTVTNKVVPPVSDDDFEGKPNYQKQAVDEDVSGDKDGIYDLSLSVSGSASSTVSGGQPINVLFVVDISSSMKEGFQGYKNRMEGANDAMSILTGALSQENGYDAKFAMVTFHGPATYKQNWTSDATKIKADITSHSQGTNYEAAIKRAKEAIEDLSEDRKDVSTVVIFISDGEPNRYYESYYNQNEYASSAVALQQAQEELDTLSGIQYFYTVGVGSEGNYSSLKNFKANEELGITNGYFPGNDKTQLQSAFQKIAQEVTYKAFSNVTINDTLSDYVSVQTNGNGDPEGFYIEVIPSGGDTTMTSNGQTKQEAGTYTATLDLDKSDMNAAATLTATYDPTAKTIVLDFPNDYKLENQWTYKVHINIQPNGNAETAYINAGYEYPTTDVTGALLPNPPAGTADADTGTCASQEGFYSNKEATITYTAQDGKRYTGTYKKPVVQLKTAEINITKTFEKLDSVSVDGFVISVNNATLNKTNRVEGSTDTVWKWTMNLPVSETAYTVQEKNYSVSTEANKVLDTVSVSGLTSGTITVPTDTTAPIDLGTLTVSDTNEKEVSITNTYKDATGILTIYKDINGDALGNGKDVFSFRIQKTDETGAVWYMQVDGEGYATVDGENTNLTLPAGTYTVTELDNINYDSTETEYQIDDGTAVKGTEVEVEVTGNGTKVTFINTPKNDGSFTDGSGVINKFSGDQTIQFEQVPIVSKDNTSNNAEH